MNTLPIGQAASRQWGDSAGGDGIGAVANSPAHTPLTVGAVGFGPAWTVEDSMAASIIRLEQENQELRAEVALAEAERIEMAKMLRSEREAHAKCQNELDSYRDDACRDKCRDKAAADGGWGNI